MCTGRKSSITTATGGWCRPTVRVDSLWHECRLGTLQHRFVGVGPLLRMDWIDETPWGWAPFHYGRWVYIDGFWAWAPGPVVRRPVYSPAMVAFMIRDHDASVRLSVGLPGLWWVALSWGEPVVPWWRHHKYAAIHVGTAGAGRASSTMW